MTIELAENRLREYALLMRLHRPIGIYLLLGDLWALVAAGHVGNHHKVSCWSSSSAWCWMRSAGVCHQRPRRPQTRISMSLAPATGPSSGSRPPRRGGRPGRDPLPAGLRLGGDPEHTDHTASFIGLALTVSYPLRKRFHHFPQLHLGAAFGWDSDGLCGSDGILYRCSPGCCCSPTCCGRRSTIPNTRWWIGEDEPKNRLKSTAIRFGEQDGGSSAICNWRCCFC